jgi:predicted Zn-dependent protease
MCAVLGRLLLLGLSLNLWAGAAWAQTPVLAYEPVALGWSAAEVERVSAEQFQALVERARRAGQLGCVSQCERIQRIYQAVLRQARHQSARAARLPWSLTVVELKDVDALAMPGGQMMISQAFVARLGDSDAALAFVLAHEMAHSILEHERQLLSYARLLLPRQVKRTVRDLYAEIDYNFALLKGLEPVMQQGELEADELGLLMASAAGFEPQQQLSFLRTEAAQPLEPRGLVASHPPMLARLRALQSRLPWAQRLWLSAAR